MRANLVNDGVLGLVKDRLADELADVASRQQRQRAETEQQPREDEDVRCGAASKRRTIAT